MTKAVYSDKVTPRESKHRILARKVACESIVLLENDGVLPLSPGKIALFGAGAACTIKGGTGSGEVNSRDNVTIWQGLKNANFEVTTENWLREYEESFAAAKAAFHKGFLSKIIFGGTKGLVNIMGEPFIYPAGRDITEEDIRKSDTDTCIYVVARQTGESCDRYLDKNTYTLDDNERKALQTLVNNYSKVILVMNVGAPMDMSFVDEIQGINAIVFFCQQGMEGGNSFADVITGATSPSGCLTNTWARKYADIPYAYEFSYLKGAEPKEYYKENIYVGYRYFDSFGVEPRYEFGYGKTYADFSVKCLSITACRSQISVIAQVRNESRNFSGKKVVQLYVCPPSGKLVREYQLLAAYAKTKTLVAGEREQLTMTFDMESLSAYDEESCCHILEAGDYILMIGESSRKNVPCGKIHINETIVTEVCSSNCGITQKMEILSEDKRAVAAATAAGGAFSPINVIELTQNDFDVVRHDYCYCVDEELARLPENVKHKLESLSIDDMIWLVTGSGAYGAKNYFDVPGAAASTTSKLISKGIRNVILCDGPAGVRVQRVSTIDKKGKIKPVEGMMEFMNYFPKIIRLFLFGNPKKDTPIYQFATAFPVGTALAQTFNTELLENVGRAIGVEMEEFGATFWLAPGINIHRNPLCGRNYEYYSEDPLLTGKTAAAVIRGVQSQPGCHVVVKHFAANNREYLRTESDSVVSERTLREIYLKGFRIAVQEAKAGGVMTAYNKVNGTYASNNYDLCINILRREWGFDGIVMTDWLSTGKGLADSAVALKTGHNMIMPGGRWYRGQLKRAVKQGRLEETELRLSAGKVLEVILRCNRS